MESSQANSTLDKKNNYEIDQLEADLIDKINKVSIDEVSNSFNGVGATTEDAMTDVGKSTSAAIEDDENSPIHYIVDDAGNIKPNRKPKNEEEWKKIFLDAYEDGENIFLNDPMALAANCITYEQKYYWLWDQQTKFLNRDTFHLKCQTLVVKDRSSGTKIAQPFSKVTVLGLTSQYAVIAAVLKPVEEVSPPEPGETMKQYVAREEKAKIRAMTDKTKDYKKTYLYRCPITIPEVKTEQIVMLNPYVRNDNQSIRRDASKPFEFKVQDVNPCWELLGSNTTLPGKVLTHHLSNSGFLTLTTEKDLDVIYLYNIHFNDPNSSPYLGVLRLNLPYMPPDMICCNNNASIICVAYNQSSGRVENNAAASSSSENSGKNAQDQTFTQLPPHIRIYTRDMESSMVSFKSPTIYVPLSPPYYQKKVLELSGYQNSDEYKMLVRELGHRIAACETITHICFNESINNAFYVCTGDGAIHALIINSQNGNYEIGGKPIFLAPSPEEEVNHLKKEVQKEKNLNTKIPVDEPIMPGDKIYRNKAREPLWNLIFKTVGVGDRIEPRLLASSENNLYIRLGLAADYDKKLDLGKMPEQIYREIGTCVGLSNCGNILALHRANNVVDIGHIALGASLGGGISRFDDPSLLSDMLFCTTSYPSVRVFSNRVVVIWPNGSLGFFLPNDADFQKKYNEEKKKAMEKRTNEEQKRRENLERKAVEEQLAVLRRRRDEIDPTQVPIDHTAHRNPQSPAAPVVTQHAIVDDDEE